MAKKKQTTYDIVWGTLFGLVFLVAGALALWSQGRGDHDWYVLGLVSLIGGWIALGMIKFGWDAATAVEKKAKGE